MELPQSSSECLPDRANAEEDENGCPNQSVPQEVRCGGREVRPLPTNIHLCLSSMLRNSFYILKIIFISIFFGRRVVHRCYCAHMMVRGQLTGPQDEAQVTKLAPEPSLRLWSSKRLQGTLSTSRISVSIFRFSSMSATCQGDNPLKLHFLHLLLAHFSVNSTMTLRKRRQ